MYFVDTILVPIIHTRTSVRFFYGKLISAISVYIDSNAQGVRDDICFFFSPHLVCHTNSTVNVYGYREIQIEYELIKNVNLDSFFFCLVDWETLFVKRFVDISIKIEHIMR